MRPIAFLGIISLALFVPLYVFIPFAFLYALWRPSYELIVLGALIDAEFGGHAVYYTLILAAVVLCSELLKPHLTFYNEHHL